MAKKFNFRLQTVLNLRSEKVKEAKDALNIALLNKYQQIEIIDSLIVEKKIQMQQQDKSVKASQMQALRDHIVSLEQEILRAESILKDLIKIETKCREKLSTALQEEKVLLKLQERKILEHKQNLQREETIFLDEVGTQLYIKNKII